MEESSKTTMKLPLLPRKLTKELWANWKSLFDSYLLVQGLEGILEEEDKLLPKNHPSVAEIPDTVDAETKKKMMRAVKKKRSGGGKPEVSN